MWSCCRWGVTYHNWSAVTVKSTHLISPGRFELGWRSFNHCNWNPTSCNETSTGCAIKLFFLFTYLAVSGQVSGYQSIIRGQFPLHVVTTQMKSNCDKNESPVSYIVCIIFPGNSFPTAAINGSNYQIISNNSKQRAGEERGERGFVISWLFTGVVSAVLATN